MYIHHIYVIYKPNTPLNTSKHSHIRPKYAVQRPIKPIKQVHRKDIPARFGVLPRHAASADEIRWIEVAGCSLFHFANAWEEDGEDGGRTIVLVGCRAEEAQLTNDLDGGDGMPTDAEGSDKTVGGRLWQVQLVKWFI